MLPSTALPNVTGRPFSTSRLPTRAVPDPWLSLLMSAVSVVLWFTRMVDGAAVWVRTMKGSNVVTAAVALVTVEMVLEGVFVPHQLSVTFAVEELLLRLLPPGAVLPAKRLKFMVREPAPVLLPSAMPPPRSVVLLPVMVTFCRLTVSVHAAGQPLLLVLVQMPPPSCAFGRFAVPAMLFVIELEVIERLTSLWIPPPFPAA